MQVAGSLLPEQQNPLAGRTLMVNLVLLAFFLLAVRIFGFSDLYDNAQPNPIAHAVDVAFNGQWLMQREPSGELATKPPMYPWLAALAVKATGSTSELVLKSPSILGFMVICAIVYDLARRALGVTGGLIAVVAWVCNPHVCKLMYTARPDMLVTMFVAVGLWSVQLQRERWVQPAPRGHDRRLLLLIALFWLSVTAATLTKGPPAALSVIWLLMAMVMDRPGRRCLPLVHFAGAVLALGLVLSWLVPVLRLYPQWLENINREVVERAAGTGSGAKRTTSRLAMFAYFVARFLPWSLFCLLAVVMWRRWRMPRLDPSPHNIRWGLWWLAMVLIFFTLPRGKRADYILPAYLGGAVLAAAVVVEGCLRTSPWSLHVRRLFTGIGLLGLASVALLAVGHLPHDLVLEPDHEIISGRSAAVLLGVCIVVLATAAALNFASREPRQMLQKWMATAWVVAAMLGIYEVAFSRSAETRGGDYVTAVVRQAHQLHKHEQLPLVFYDVAKTPVQSLLGNNDILSDEALERAEEGAILIISGRAWQREQERFKGRGEVRLHTPMIPEAKVELILVRIEPRTASGQ